MTEVTVNAARAISIDDRAGSLRPGLPADITVFKVERGEVDRFEPELSSRDLDLATLQEIEHDAYAWVHGLIQSHAA